MMPMVPAFDIPYLTHGRRLSEAGFAVGILIPPSGEEMPDRDDFSAGVHLGWDELGLRILASVVWRETRVASEQHLLRQHCSVEFILALGPDAGCSERCQWVVAPGSDPQFAEPRSHLHDYRQAGGLLGLPAEAAFRWDVTDGTYQVDGLLPWSALGLAATPGAEIRFQVMVNDAGDGSRPQRHLRWHPRPGDHADVRCMQRLRLAVDSHPPLSARLRRGRSYWQVVAPPAAKGQEVAVIAEGQVVTSGILEVDRQGYASCRMPHARIDADLAQLTCAGTPVDVLALRPHAWPSPEQMGAVAIGMAFAEHLLTVTFDLPTSPAGWLIQRRLPGEAWRTLAESAADGLFHDAGLVRGTEYEYAIIRLGGSPAHAYRNAGAELPLKDRRGTILLLIERSLAHPLAAEIQRLGLDLIGDGWRVWRQEVAAEAQPQQVRELIQKAATSAGDVEAVLLLGHLPVPYSGAIAPDGHQDHLGTWPTDVVYANPDGAWTDERATSAAEARQGNSAGDGKWDQDAIPGQVRFAVGRIDLRDLPAFADDEVTLMRRHLDRNHAYRHGRLAVIDEALVQDGFPGHAEAFAQNGWRNGFALVGPKRTRTAEWPDVEPGTRLLYYACGPGGWRSMGGFGTTEQLAENGLAAVFTMLFGSYFGDWDRPDNLLRAALAAGALTSGWAGRPHWFLHPLAMGWTIGECLRLTQNNSGTDYQPTGAYPCGVHVALLGDPTLRISRVAPPADLRGHDDGHGGRRLIWTASSHPGATYHVYRRDAEDDVFSRLTADPVRACSWQDADGDAGSRYMLRAVALVHTDGGSHLDASQGIFDGDLDPFSRLLHNSNL